MPRYHFIIFMLLMYSSTVKGQFLWLETTRDGIALDRITGQEISQSVPDQSINHHALFKLDNPIHRTIPQSASGITIFSVYHQDKRQSEELVWQINEGQEDKILHTTLRTANLMDGQFINYSNEGLGKTKLTTYYLNRSFRNEEDLLIGSRPSNEAIPVHVFSGEYAEIIAFEKVLSPLSIQIIQSMLALKYSLHLPSDHNYLGLQGELLWDRKNGDFQHQIGGIGLLEEMHFNQQKATTKLNQGSFTCTASDSLFSNNSYVLWADNQHPLKFICEHKDVMKLDRQWQIRSIRNRKIPLQINIDHKEIVQNITADESFYGLVRMENDFEVFPMHKDSNNSISGSVVLSHNETTFQLMKAPTFWVYLHIENPTCTEANTGKMSGQILGGQPPYRVSITNPDGTLESFVVDEDRFEYEVTNSGLYSLQISDKNQNKWQTFERVNYGDLPIPDLADKIYIKADHARVVPFHPVPGDLLLEWIFPNGQTQFRDWIQPEMVGAYTLIVRKGPCENRYNFEVERPHSYILDAKVYPNPASSSTQFFTASLEETSPYSIVISRQDGRTISHVNHPASQYLYHEFSLSAGVYVISLQVGNAISNHPLIVLQN